MVTIVTVWSGDGGGDCCCCCSSSSAGRSSVSYHSQSRLMAVARRCLEMAGASSAVAGCRGSGGPGGQRRGHQGVNAAVDAPAAAAAVTVADTAAARWVLVRWLSCSLCLTHVWRLMLLLLLVLGGSLHIPRGNSLMILNILY